MAINYGKGKNTSNYNLRSDHGHQPPEDAGPPPSRARPRRAPHRRGPGKAQR